MINRYPKVLEKLAAGRGGYGDARDYGEPHAFGGAGPIDNLYLDMNGIIHPCFHPEDGEAPASEEEVYMRILAYIDNLLALTKPRRLLFLAVDGPAPRAKMNQQRARRFKSAQEAELKRRVEDEVSEAWRSKGKAPPPPKPQEMDSNVITPGSAFMANLGRWLRHYAYMKLNTPGGEHAHLRIILSDASVPGEGEHKVMAFVRAQRLASGYDPNQHHCIHGLDADLMMLALATHETRFSILREVQVRKGKGKGKGKGGGKGKGDAGGGPEFELVRVAVLREYLYREFEGADWSGVRDGFNLERAIDDFVFLCFFVGNDFLPHMPSLEIRDGAIDAMLVLYKKYVSSDLRGYVTCNGEVNFTRLQALLVHLGQLEREIFASKRYQDQQQERQRERREKQDRLDRLARLESEVDDTDYRGQSAIQRAVPMGQPGAAQPYGSAARQAFLAKRGLDEPAAIVSGKKRLRGEGGGEGPTPQAPLSQGADERGEVEEEELDGGVLHADPPEPEPREGGSEAGSEGREGSAQSSDEGGFSPPPLPPPSLPPSPPPGDDVTAAPVALAVPGGEEELDGGTLPTPLPPGRVGEMEEGEMEEEEMDGGTLPTPLPPAPQPPTAPQPLPSQHHPPPYPQQLTPLPVYTSQQPPHPPHPPRNSHPPHSPYPSCPPHEHSSQATGSRRPDGRSDRRSDDGRSGRSRFEVADPGPSSGSPTRSLI